MNTPNTNTKPKATPITGQAPKPAPAAPQTTPTQAATASTDPACKTAPKAAARPLEEILAEQIAAAEADLKTKKRKLQTIRQKKAALAKSAERKERGERLRMLGYAFSLIIADYLKRGDETSQKNGKNLAARAMAAYDSEMKPKMTAMSESQRERCASDRKSLLAALDNLILEKDLMAPPLPTPQKPQNTPS